MILDERVAAVSSEVVRGVEPRADGRALRVQTAVRYPDGDLVDVFLDDGDFAANLLLDRVVSDQGNTLTGLHDVSSDPVVWERFDVMIEAVLRVYDAHRHGGALTVRIAHGESLGAAILRLATACAAVAHQGLGLANGLR